VSKYAARFEDHPIFQALQNLEDRLEDAAAHLTSADTTEDHSRLGAIAARVGAVLDRADPVLADPNQLEAAKNSIDQAVSEVTAFTSDKQPNHLANANTHAEAALRPLALVPAALDVSDVTELRSSATAFRQSAGQLVRHLESEVQTASAQVDKLQDQSEKTATRLSEIESQVGAATNSANETFAQQQRDLAQRIQVVIDEERAKFAPALDAFKEESEKQETERRAEFEKLIETASQRVDKALQKSEQSAEEMDRLLDEARKTVAVLSQTALGGGYAKVAEEAHQRSFWWFIGALGLAALGVMGGGYLLFIHSPSPEGLSIAETIRRGVFSLIMFAPATLALREATGHRTESLGARDLAMQLQSLAAYIESDPDQDVLSQVASNYFKGGSLKAERPDQNAPIVGPGGP